MKYSSPFSLLDFDGFDPGHIDDEVIRKARKRLMTEFELTGKTTIAVNGREYDRSQVIAILDGLKENKDLDFHWRIYQSPLLRDFLENDTFPKMGQAHVDGYTRDIAFLDFISPYVAYTYDNLLRNRIKCHKYDEALTLLEMTMPVNAVWRYRMFERTDEYLKHILARLEQLADESNRHPPWKSDVEPYVTEAWLKFLNALPEAKSELRSDLALAMCNVGIKLYNKSVHRRPLALKLVRASTHVKADPETRAIVRDRFQALKALMQPAKSQRSRGSGQKTWLYVYVPLKIIFLLLLVGRHCERDRSYSYTYKPRTSQSWMQSESSPAGGLEHMIDRSSRLGAGLGGRMYKKLSEALEVHSRFVEDTTQSDETIEQLRNGWSSAMRPETGDEPYASLIGKRPNKYSEVEHVEVFNFTEDDAIVFLYNPTKVYDHRYIRKGESVILRRVQDQANFVDIYVGSQFHPDAPINRYHLPQFGDGDTTNFEPKRVSDDALKGGFLEPVNGPSFGLGAMRQLIFSLGQTNKDMGMYTTYEITVYGPRGEQTAVKKQKTAFH